ncbi:MAG: hypothetical protein PHH82_02720 [Candidatus ainarchaeum sp.]|nr:hypothetical protein [Candidatus ainarchaeum sp.]
MTAKEKVFEFLKKENKQYTPKIISKLLQIDINTTRGALIDLYKTGVVSKSHHYYYVPNEQTNGVDYLAQNCGVKYQTKQSIIHKEKEIQLNHIKIRIIYGEKNNQVTAKISCEPPISIELLIAAILKVKEDIFEEIKELPKDTEIQITTLELNQDYPNWRFDGINCMTLNDVWGFLKIYNKDNPTRVRKELRARLKITLADLQQLLTYGITESTNRVYLDHSIADLKQTIAVDGQATRNIIYAALDKHNKHIPSTKEEN